MFPSSPEPIIELGGIVAPGVYPVLDAGWTPGPAVVQVEVGPTPAPEPTAIVCGITEGPAGDSVNDSAASYAATVPPRSGGKYAWAITNGYILKGQGTHQILFALGEKMQDCVIRCDIKNVVTGMMKTETFRIAVLPYPRTVRIEAAMVPPGGTVTGAVTMHRAITIQRVTSSAAARLRLYRTAALREEDIQRVPGVNPTGDHGQILEVITTAEQPVIVLNPEAKGANGDSPQQRTIYWTITNRTSVTVQNLTFDIDYIQEV